MNNPNILHINHIDSTNNYFKSARQKAVLEEGTAIMADFQEHGRGQVGNTWQSNEKENILLSVYLKPTFIPIEKIFAVNMIISLAVVAFLKEQKMEATIKWPNDILVKKKKVCGILIENTLQGANINDSITGIGLNVNQTKFPDFDHAATSLSLENNETQYDVSFLASALVDKILMHYQHQRNYFNFEQLTKTYHANLHGMHKWLQFKDDESVYEGQIQGVDAFGFLNIRDRNGQNKSYAFKEVSFLEL